MPSQNTQPRTARSRLLESLCEQLPNCTKALALAETGCERDLTLRERIALRYNSRLCPFCACATGKFESAMNRMQEAEASRKAG